LTLIDCYFLSDKGLEAIATGCKELTHLEVNGCHNIGTLGIEYIGRSCQYVFLWAKLLAKMLWIHWLELSNIVGTNKFKLGYAKQFIISIVPLGSFNAFDLSLNDQSIKHHRRQKFCCPWWMCHASLLTNHVMCLLMVHWGLFRLFWFMNDCVVYVTF